MKKSNNPSKFSEGIYREYLYNFNVALDTLLKDNALKNGYTDVDFDSKLIQEVLAQMYHRYYKVIRIPDIRINIYPSGYFHMENISYREDSKYFKKEM